MYYFDWDENKNRINLEKHGITFEEASTVFFDERAILLNPYLHSVAISAQQIQGFPGLDN